MTPNKPRTIDRIADVQARLILARDQHGVLMRCGLTTEADTIQRRINALNVELHDLEQLNEREQQATKALLYECFVGCDLLTELADDFAAAIALREYGCYRLGAIIFLLRADGHDITTKRVETKSRITGRTVRFANYLLNDENRAH